MRFGDFQLSIIRECSFKLDGGAMFGVVPRTLWSRQSPPDEANRISLSCNLLLIETPAGRVLVETGMGDRWSARERERYELRSLVDHAAVLESVGLRNEDVDCVVISHLHFDHAGGATRLVDGKLVPTYPRARYFVQAGEWQLARSANARARASYRPDDFMPLYEAGVLEIIDGDREILPGIRVSVSGGHTSHHQVCIFESGGRKGVYFADLVPTAAHVNPAWVMGYDHFPLASCDAKDRFLNDCVSQQWLVVFDHEPAVPWGHVTVLDSRFSFSPLSGEPLVRER